MPIIKSKIDVNSAAFKENTKHYQNILQQLRDTLEKIRAGDPEALEKHLSRDKIPA